LAALFRANRKAEDFVGIGCKIDVTGMHGCCRSDDNKPHMAWKVALPAEKAPSAVCVKG
jgi:hypothetical protein